MDRVTQNEKVVLVLQLMYSKNKIKYYYRKVLLLQ